MYIIDEIYNDLINDYDRKEYITGTLITTDKTKIDITDDNLIAETLTITNQSINQSTFNLGTVYSSQCSFAILTDIDRYKLYNAEITLYLHIIGYDKAIPLGTFYVTEAKRINKKVSITACDSMLNFDGAILADLKGTAYNCLYSICRNVGIKLSQTQEEINALCNATQTFIISMDEIGSYRDAISYIASMTCTFATITRFNCLKLQSYADTSTGEIDNNGRMKNAEYSDYEVQFRGVNCRFLANENYYTYEETDSTRTEGLILSLGDIPIFSGTDTQKHQLLQNIYTELKKIKYTPFNIKIKPNPVIELGDMITSININNDTYISCTSLIMYYQWNYRQAMILKSLGDNPKLALIKSKVGKSSGSLAGQIASANEQLANLKISVSNLNDRVIDVEDSLDSKVDKVSGKELSSNDFTDNDKVKLSGLSNYDDTKIKSDLALKQDKLTAGNNVNITGNVISATDTVYDDTSIKTSLNNKVDKVSGKGLSTNDYTTTEKNKLSSLSNYDDTSIKNSIATKQDKLTAGANITIDSNNVISASGGGSGGSYTAGANITISNNVISATDTKYTAGTNVTISNNVISSGFTYSQDEKWTGDYWYDGKKIYTQTIVGTLVNGTTSKLITIPNLYDVWTDKANSFLWGKNTNLGSGLSCVSPDYGNGAGETDLRLRDVDRTNGTFTLLMWLGSSWNGGTKGYVITIRYTKTTG